MKKIITSFLLILMIAVIGMIVLFIKSINYVNYENYEDDLVFEETTKASEIVKDYTKEVERDERIYLMVKDGDEIHNDNEYLTVLWNYTDNINVTDFDSSLERMGIIEELKEKKYIENVLPIPYDIDYEVWMNINYANYEKKVAEVFIRYRESNRCEKYLISFDYNDEYYLTKYEVLRRTDITLEDFKKIAIPLGDQK